ncbi:MAG: lipid-A-disaccharide synthase [Saprospiraceae bacterium]
MKIFIIAGEKSGDLHGSEVVKFLFQKNNEIQIEGMGGDALISQGMKIFVNIRELNVMGISDVMLRLPFFYRLYSKCKIKILQFQPDVLLLIDYSGFNLRMAAWAKKQGIKIHYYIAPKTWAWRAKRNVDIRNHIDYLHCIFPFEEAYFKSEGINAKYVGNPTMKTVQKNVTIKDNVIALLPGSRIQELKYILPVFSKLIMKNPHFEWVLSKVAHIDENIYKNLLGDEVFNKIELSKSTSHYLLASSKLAIITSGTATLEAAVLGCPQIVVYKTSVLNYFIGKRFIQNEFISLPNIILNTNIVDELIQNNLTVGNLEKCISKLKKSHNITTLLEKYTQVKKILGDQNPGNNVAECIIKNTV